ncbi:MAG TPA: hypothetical protein VJM76_01740 [Gammaproteobacteria bacterium]|nr:hypothetical protein [Gammaproteobacteria bacterium]
MKTLQVAMVRICIPNDEAHLERVLQAIDDFSPGGDVHVLEARAAFDSDGKRQDSKKERSLIVEYFEETCRAQIFVDTFNDELMPCRMLGWTMLMLEGDSLTESREKGLHEQAAASAGSAQAASASPGQAPS